MTTGKKLINKSGWKGILRIIVGCLLGLSVTFALIYSRELVRIYRVNNLFESDRIVENFRSMYKIFPATKIRRAGAVFEFGRSPGKLPESFSYKGKTYNVKEFLKTTGTTGLVVIQDDKIRFEEYYRGNTKDTHCISWSVGKSFVSALLGIAIEEGHIKSLQDPVTKYAPELKGTGYDGVSIKDVAQMSSGVRFNEDYGDYNSDINRMGRVLALGSSINEFAAGLSRERKPGEYHHYMSMDTQILGIVITRATGITLSRYLEEKIWKKIGMQSDAYWLLDDKGMELAFGTLNVTLLDFARFGRLYLNNGNWNGAQIVPAAWVKASVTPDAPHLQPGPNPASANLMGYGLQWWIPETPRGDYMAIGIYNQFIYVNPAKKMIIAKTSANADYTAEKELADTDLLTTALFQTIAGGD